MKDVSILLPLTRVVSHAHTRSLSLGCLLCFSFPRHAWRGPGILPIYLLSTYYTFSWAVSSSLRFGRACMRACVFRDLRAQQHIPRPLPSVFLPLTARRGRPLLHAPLRFLISTMYHRVSALSSSPSYYRPLPSTGMKAFPS